MNNEINTDVKLLPPPIHPLLTYQNKAKSKKIINFSIIFLIVVTFISCLAIINGIYFKNWNNKIFREISDRLPLPALLINGDFIFLRDYYRELSAVRNFYQQQYPETTFSEANLKIQVLNKLIEQKIIEQAAKERQLNVNQSQIDQEIENIKKLTPGQDLDQLTNQIFGWNFQEFTERVIKPEILTEQLNDYFYNNSDLQNQRLAMIDDIDQKIKNGEDFMNYGENIGWFEEQQIPPEVITAIKNLTAGQTTGIINLQDGYYMLQLNNKIANDDGSLSYELNQIAVKKYNLTDYLSEQRRQTRIFRFINI